MLSRSPKTYCPLAKPIPSENLCLRCACIDFEEFFNTPFRMHDYWGHGYRNAIDLGCIGADAGSSRCQLCRLFSQVRLRFPGDEVEHKEYFLCILSSVYKNSIRRQTDDLFDTPILVVLRCDRKIEVSLQIEFIYPTLIPGNPAEAIVGRRVPAYLDYDILKSWINFCCENHRGTCGADDGDLLPVPGFRLIDCSTGKIISAPAGVKFVALSYVWGIAPMPPDTPYENVLGSASLVIRDAMIVTINVGYRYLWVDRYCIPQDDERARHHQIQRMNLIYQRAQLTIICAAGQDASDGIPGVSSARALQPRADLPGFSLVSSLPSPQHDVNQSKWATRGWTYQEGLLSRRCLVFTQNQASFQCQTNYHPFESVNEPDFTRIRPQLAGYPSNRANNPLPLKLVITASDVHDRLNEYLKRELTYESDALNAISGVLSAFVARNVIDGHVWGIPVINGLSYHRSGGRTFRPMSFSDRIAHGLCWVQRPRAGSTTQSLIRRRVGFPSWSWVGWVGLRSWRYLTSVNDGIGWPTSQPFVEPSHYPCTFTFVWDNGTQITLSNEQIDAPFDLDMQGMPRLLVETWSFSLRFTEFPRNSFPKCHWEREYPWESAISWDMITANGEPPWKVDDSDPKSDLLLCMRLVRWDEGHIHEPAVREHVLNSTWIALVIGYGIIHPGLDILIVEKVGDHFERAGILRLQGQRPTIIGPNSAILLGVNLERNIFMLG